LSPLGRRRGLWGDRRVGIDEVRELLLLWLPRKHAADRLLNSNAELWKDAIEALHPFADDLSDSRRTEIALNAAIAVGRSELQDVIDGGSQVAGPANDGLNQRNWGDLAFAALCLCRDDKANRRLIELVDKEVVPTLAKQFGSDRALDWAAELPSFLHVEQQTGLNRGRRRLYSYGGKSSLAGWLRTVAVNRAKSELKEASGHTSDDAVLEGLSGNDGDPINSATDEEAGVEDPQQLDRLRDAIERSLREVTSGLRVSAPSQFQYAYLRFYKRLRHVDIAKRMGVTKQNVTRLAKLVCEKLRQTLMDMLTAEGMIVITPELLKRIDQIWDVWCRDAFLPPLEPGAYDDLGGPQP
jgi:RNA polymerase sigma factor (sigma-70 family)